MKRGSSLDIARAQTYFRIVPQTLIYKSKHANNNFHAYIVYLEKGLQIVGKSSEIPTQFFSPEQEKYQMPIIQNLFDFQVTNQKHLSFTWSLYAVHENGMQERIDGKDINIKSNYIQYNQDRQSPNNWIKETKLDKSQIQIKWTMFAQNVFENIEKLTNIMFPQMNQSKAIQDKKKNNNKKQQNQEQLLKSAEIEGKQNQYTLLKYQENSPVRLKDNLSEGNDTSTQKLKNPLKQMKNGDLMIPQYPEDREETPKILHKKGQQHNNQPQTIKQQTQKENGRNQESNEQENDQPIRKVKTDDQRIIQQQQQFNNQVNIVQNSMPIPSQAKYVQAQSPSVQVMRKGSAPVGEEVPTEVIILNRPEVGEEDVVKLRTSQTNLNSPSQERLQEETGKDPGDNTDKKDFQNMKLSNKMQNIQEKTKKAATNNKKLFIIVVIIALLVGFLGYSLTPQQKKTKKVKKPKVKKIKIKQ